MSSKKEMKESWLFQGLPTEVLSRIEKIATEKKYSSGTTIFSEGSAARDLYILGLGEVELSFVLHCRSPVTMRIARVLPGDVFAWSALAKNEKLTADARAVTDSVAYLIPADGLLEIMNADPVVGYQVMTRLSQLIAQRLRETRSELRWIQSSI